MADSVNGNCQADTDPKATAHNDTLDPDLADDKDHPHCEGWARDGECDVNIGYVFQNSYLTHETRNILLLGFFSLILFPPLHRL